MRRLRKEFIEVEGVELDSCKGCMLLLSNTLEEEEATLMRDGLHYFGPCAKANSVFSQAREIVNDVPLESLCCDVQVEDEVMDYDPMQTGQLDLD